MRKLWCSWNGEIISIDRIVEKFADGIKKIGVEPNDLHDPSDALFLASQVSGLSVPELMEI